MNSSKINYFCLAMIIIAIFVTACLEDYEGENKTSSLLWLNMTCDEFFQVTQFSDNSEVYFDCTSLGGCSPDSGYCTKPSTLTGNCSGKVTTCQNDKMFVCNNETWIQVQTCSDGCDKAGTKCGGFSDLTSGKCTIGATKCESDNVYLCNGMGKWSVIEPCDGRGCEGSACKKTSERPDVIKVCTSGAFKCEDNIQYLCGIDGTWEIAKSCGSLGCVGKMCAEEPTVTDCVAGTHKCENDTQYLCSESGSWSEEKSCNTLGCLENECKSAEELPENNNNCPIGGTKCEKNCEYICLSDGSWEFKQLCFSGCNNAQTKCNDD